MFDCLFDAAQGDLLLRSASAQQAVTESVFKNLLIAYVLAVAISPIVLRIYGWRVSRLMRRVKSGIQSTSFDLPPPSNDPTVDTHQFVEILEANQTPSPEQRTRAKSAIGRSNRSLIVATVAVAAMAIAFSVVHTLNPGEVLDRAATSTSAFSWLEDGMQAVFFCLVVASPIVFFSAAPAHFAKLYWLVVVPILLVAMLISAGPEARSHSDLMSDLIFFWGSSLLPIWGWARDAFAT